MKDTREVLPDAGVTTVRCRCHFPGEAATVWRGGHDTDPLSQEIGRALRRVRRSRGLTLRAVAQASQGAFKATSVAGYERGERAITVERFCRLCEVYDFPAQELLSEILSASRRRSDRVIDLAALESLTADEATLVANFVQQVLSLRRDPGTQDVSLRSGDLQVLATASGTTTEELSKLLDPALKEPT